MNKFDLDSTIYSVVTPFLCNVRRSVILSEAVSKPRVAVVYRVLLVAQVVVLLLSSI